MSIQYEDIALPLGKHKGELLANIPNSYLNWLVDQEFVEEKHNKLYHLALREKEYRESFDIIIE